MNENEENNFINLAEDEAIDCARMGSLLAFTLLTKPDYQTNWHHKALAKKLNAFIRGDIRFLMVFMPPRHGKSELVSRRLPALLHGLYPDSEIMAVSYLDSLAGEMTVNVQNIIDSPMYARIFPGTRIWPSGTSYSKGVRNSSEHSIIGKRGKYRGQGVGGSFTGKGANFIIIDDPIKGREVADSVAFRERLWEFWNNDLFSRLETDLATGRPGQVLVTQTRWHEDDLSGRLLEQMRSDEHAIQWDIVKYPAIKIDDEDKSDVRAVGEALWPAKFPIAELEKIKVTAQARGWSSLYQQSPVPLGGGCFTDNMFEYDGLPNRFDYSFITADTAYKEKEENDFTCFSCWGVLRDQIYLRDVWRKKIKAAEIETPAEAFIRKFLGYGYRHTWIEPKGHGIYLNQKFATRRLMIPHEARLKEFYEDRRFDKVERANNVVGHLSTRTIKINNQLHLKEDLVAEALGFPKWKSDDFVDTLVDALKIVYAKKVTVFDAFKKGA